MTATATPPGVPVGTTALAAFRAIQATGGRAPLVDGTRVVGTVVDAALRRAVLDGVDLAAVPVDRFAEPAPTQDQPGTSGPARAVAVVQAGGKGSRLAPLTLKLPKPLLAVGGTTILGRLLEGLAASAVTDVYISVNYMADTIEERIGDGSAFGVSVRYLREDQPLGNAGPLALLPERPTVPILVLNADQITTLVFSRMVDFHLAEGVAMTMASFSHEVTLPYGVVRAEGGRLAGVDEKPTLRFPCNAGFYVIDPDVIDLVPEGRHSTMLDLSAALLASGREVAVFPLLERWIDIGSPEELEAALLWAATGEEA